MPFRDGTGPRGRGPLSGRCQGLCAMSRGRSGVPGRNVTAGFAASILALLVRDLANPEGIVRRVLGRLKPRIRVGTDVGFLNRRKMSDKAVSQGKAPQVEIRKA